MVREDRALAARFRQPDFEAAFGRVSIDGFPRLLAHELIPLGVLHADLSVRHCRHRLPRQHRRLRPSGDLRRRQRGVSGGPVSDRGGHRFDRALPEHDFAGPVDGLERRDGGAGPRGQSRASAGRQATAHRRGDFARAVGSRVAACSKGRWTRHRRGKPDLRVAAGRWGRGPGAASHGGVTLLATQRRGAPGAGGSNAQNGTVSQRPRVEPSSTGSRRIASSGLSGSPSFPVLTK